MSDERKNAHLRASVDRPEARRVGVRPATENDLLQLNDIYNHYVRETHITFDLEPITMDARRDWFAHYQEVGPHRLFVAVDGDRLLGHASSSPWRPKRAYDTSVETSIYLAPDATGRGVGSTLYATLFTALEDEDVHRCYGGIALPNPASIALHEHFGFSPVAYFSEQGHKFGRYWDVAWYEKPMPD